MLSSEFNDELGSLIRSLQQRVLNEPAVKHGDERDVLASLERAIISLVNMHIEFRRRQ